VKTFRVIVEFDGREESNTVVEAKTEMDAALRALGALYFKGKDMSKLKVYTREEATA
jgi:hypothetical protein